MPHQKAPTICPVCQKIPRRSFDFIQDYKSEDDKFSLYECPECEIQFWIPFKNPGADFYQKSDLYYDGLRILSEQSFMWNHEQFFKNPPHKNPDGKKLLDVGCGDGLFLSRAQKLGYEVCGFDFNPEQIKYAKRYYKLENIFVGTLDTFLKSHSNILFDVISFFEVIEHLDNPKEFIIKALSILRPGGFLIISIPNRHRYWMNYYEKTDLPPHHLTRWSSRSLSNFLEKFNLKIVNHSTEIPLIRLMKLFNFGILIRIKKKAVKTKGGKTVDYLNLQEKNIPLFLKGLILLGKFKESVLKILCWLPAFILNILGYSGDGQYILAKKSQ